MPCSELCNQQQQQTTEYMNKNGKYQSMLYTFYSQSPVRAPMTRDVVKSQDYLLAAGGIY